MVIGDQILFFVSGLGVFNGLLMAIYFLLPIHKSKLRNLLFGGLLLALSIRIGKSVFLYFIPELSEVVRQIGLSSCTFIGPLLLFYQRRLFRDLPRLGLSERLQLVLILVLVLTVGLLFPYSRRADLWNPLIVQFIYAVWIGYILFAGYELKLFLRDESIKSSILGRWAVITYTTNLIISLIFHSVMYVGFPPYITGPIAFSLIFYVLLLFLIFSPHTLSILRDGGPAKPKTALPDLQVEGLKKELERVMLEDHAYRDSNLKLASLAKLLGIKSHVLSRFLNEEMGRSFPTFINEYRIEAATKLLQNDSALSFEGIGQEVGFRSKSSFYAAFKKIHATTPTGYLKNSKKE